MSPLALAGVVLVVWYVSRRVHAYRRFRRWQHETDVWLREVESSLRKA